MKIISTSILAIIVGCAIMLPQSLSAQVSGTVFRDFNANGVKDNLATFNEPFVQGITIKAYDVSGTEVGNTTSDASGAYSFTGLTLPLRIEFMGYLASDYSAPIGGGNNTSVQFHTSASTTANFGVNEPDDYWDNTTDPRYVIPQYINGLANVNAAETAIASTFYSSTGLNSNYTAHDGTPGTGPVPRTDITTDQVGTVWGAAYHKSQKHYYFTTFLKRHCGMADGPGYIYNMDYSGASPVLAGSFDLQGVIPANGGAAIDLGSVTRTGSADYTLSASKSTPNRDIDAYGKVATMSFGDCDIQSGTDYLWTVNLFQQALIRIDVSGNPTSLPAGVEQYILSSLPGYPTSATGILRPWALKFARGKGYLGLVDDASISGLATDLKAIVLEFDPNNIALGFTQKLNFDPNPKRIASGGSWLIYKHWMNTYSEASANVSGDYRARAQPVLSDIEFDENDNMYVSFFDRFGHQMGYYNYLPLPGSTTLVRVSVYGEIDIACKTATGWEIEGTGACYPSSAEFFQDISGDNERESSNGAVALLKGRGQLLQVSGDPHPQGITGTKYFNQQGTHTYNLTTGTIDNWYAFYYDATVAQFGKVNGMGDVEFINPPPPIEIGNRIWSDTDEDGIQDAGETGINGITVQLYEGATLVGTATTANGGQWFFNNTNVNQNGATELKPNTAYTVRVASAQFPAGQSLSTSNVGGAGQPDVRDSDAALVGGNAEIAYITGNYGQNDHTLDIGFKAIAAPNPDLSLQKSVDVSTAAINDQVTFTLTLTNDNGIDATGVVVTDNLPVGVTFVSSSDPANVTVSGNILTWNVGNMLGADAPKDLQITVTADNEGSFVNTAEITAMNETDDDSTPNNNVAGEDDEAQACFSVPVKLCSDNTGATITMTSGTATSWQWYISTDNGATYTALSGETSQDLVVDNTLMGGNNVTKYFKVAYNGAAITDGCGATMCCPVIVTTETCVTCPTPKCLPIIITKL